MDFVHGTDLKEAPDTSAGGFPHRRRPRSCPRWAPPSTPPTPAAWCTATSSRPTCCSRVERRDASCLPDRLRPHQARQLGERHDRDRDVRRHDGLHRPRAGPGRPARRARRRLLARLRALSEPDRRASPTRATPRWRSCGPTWASRPPRCCRSAPEVPSGFEDVVARAMAKDPAERYPSAGDLGRAALAVAEARSITPHGAQRGDRRRRRRPRPAPARPRGSAAGVRPIRGARVHAPASAVHAAAARRRIRLSPRRPRAQPATPPAGYPRGRLAHPHASWGARGGAMLIDWVAVAILSIVIAAPRDGSVRATSSRSCGSSWEPPWPCSCGASCPWRERAVGTGRAPASS